MTGTNEQADLKIRLERMERLVADHEQGLSDAAELIRGLAKKVEDQAATIATHDFKLEILCVAFTTHVKENSKVTEALAESHLRHLMEHAAEKLGIKTAPGQDTTPEDAQRIIAEVFDATGISAQDREELTRVLT